MELTSQVVEGIKFIKLYGWEMAFKKIIQGVREKQLTKLERLALGRAIERGLGNFIGLAGSIVMLFLATTTGV